MSISPNHHINRRAAYEISMVIAVDDSTYWPEFIRDASDRIARGNINPIDENCTLIVAALDHALSQAHGLTVSALGLRCVMDTLTVDEPCIDE